jgi:tetratricopeptide (TPR) repeat protein
MRAMPSFLALIAWLILALAPRYAFAGEVPSNPSAQVTAASHFRRGVERYDASDYEEALREFQLAYATSPDFRVLYNIGQAHFELRDYASAFRAFRQYLTEGGERVPDGRRDQVEADLGRLAQRVARVRIRTDVEGAKVYVDNGLVATTPLDAPVIVNLGKHKIGARAGDRSVTKTIDVAGGDDVEVVLQVGPDQPAPPAPATAASSSNGRRVVGYVLTGLGVALLASAAVADFVVLPKAIDDFDAKRNRDDPTAVDTQSKIRTVQALTVVGYATGVVASGVGLTLILWPDKKAQSSSAALELRGNRLIATMRF